MENKNKKDKFHEEIDSLFEKLAKKREQGLSNIEDLKEILIAKLDKEISILYAKKDLVGEMWAKRRKLRLERVSFLRKVFRNSLWINLKFIFSMPFIYGMIVPGVFLHITIEIYHQVCFRIYRIPRVKMSEYFIFDRQLLPYLNWFEKFNCIYCSYINCLMAYSREIAGRTERYWCPIKHSKILKDRHGHYAKFVDYSDGESFRKEWKKLRNFK